MKYSLLEIVQLVLSSMDSDEVNSISDTVESNQVALICKSVYYDIATDIGLPEHETVFQLNASGDNTKPCMMTIPTTVVKMRNLRYDNKEDTDTVSMYVDVNYKTVEDFIQWTSLGTENTNVEEQILTFNGEEFKFKYRTDKFPQFYTTVDNDTLIFDSFRLDIENTLVKAKTMCQGNIYPEFQMVDSFVPDINPSEFSYFVNKVKYRAFNELKQQDNQEAGSEMRRQKVIVQKRKNKTPDQQEVYKVPRYGKR
jgi:hypothetical protein